MTVVVTGVYHFLNLIEMYVNSSSVKLIFKCLESRQIGQAGPKDCYQASRGSLYLPMRKRADPSM